MFSINEARYNVVKLIWEKSFIEDSDEVWKALDNDELHLIPQDRWAIGIDLFIQYNCKLTAPEQRIRRNKISEFYTNTIMFKNEMLQTERSKVIKIMKDIKNA